MSWSRMALKKQTKSGHLWKKELQFRELMFQAHHQFDTNEIFKPDINLDVSSFLRY